MQISGNRITIAKSNQIQFEVFTGANVVEHQLSTNKLRSLTASMLFRFGTIIEGAKSIKMSLEEWSRIQCFEACYPAEEGKTKHISTERA